MSAMKNMIAAAQQASRNAGRAGGGGGQTNTTHNGLSASGVILGCGGGIPFILKAAVGLVGAGVLLNHSLYTVQGGHRAVLFNRIRGVEKETEADGTHLLIPFLQYPTIYDIRSKPKVLKSPTGTRDLQMVDITLRVLYKPDEKALPLIHQTLGENYDERILPSIANETLKSVIACFNASQLITQRQEVSHRIKDSLIDRARQFHIIIDDVSITHTTFGTEYMAAIEAKQVAQQEAERAKFLVKQALQDKKSTIIKAQGEATSAAMIGEAIRENPGYIELRQLDAAKQVAETVAKSQNKVYLESDSLLLNILQLSESGNRLDTTTKRK